LLALLLLRANEVVPRERLIDELWPDAPPAAARDTVKVYVGRLRKVLEQDGSPEVLLTRGGGYGLKIEPDQLDLNRFERLAARGSRELTKGDAEGAAATLDKALSLWQGTALVDLGNVPFVRAEQARLEEIRLAATEDAIEANLALGRASAVVPELQRLTREHPYRERLHRQLMLALYRAGRQAEALAAYRNARSILVEQLGIEPSNELRDLEKAILAHDAALETPAEEESPGPVAVSASSTRAGRRRLLIAGAAALLAAAAAVAVLLTRADATVEVRPNSVAVIDPSSNELVSSIPVGRAPSSVAAGSDGVWVGNSADDTVMKIDPASRTDTATIPVPGSPAALVAEPGGVWVVTGAQSIGSRLDLARIDPRHLEAPSEQVRLGSTYGFPRQPLAVNGSTVWASGLQRGTLTRRDPTTLGPRGAVDLGGVASAITEASDGMWATTWDDRLLHISPLTGQAIDVRAAIGHDAFDVASDGNALWIASFSDDVITRYDPAAGSSTTVSVGDGPTAVAFGFGSIWVACSGDGTIWRIDPSTRKVLTHWSLGASPEDIAAGEGAVWVTVYSGLAP
jgi:YVTN family beta-propeller protein